MSIQSKDILSAFDVEKGSMLIPNLMVVLGMGTLIKMLASSEKFDLISWILPLVLVGLPLLVYVILKMKELRYSNVLAVQKSLLIMVFPSNLGLLKKVLNIPKNEALNKNKFGVEKIYFLVTKNMPLKEEDKKAMLDFLNAYGVKVEIRRVDALENPKKLQKEVEGILKSIPNKSNCALNVQTGTKASSIFLYELAIKNNVEVHYLSSLYDKDNNPIDGSENLYTLKSEYVDKREWNILNYGYAFIYHRVQSSLIKTGVNLYHSFLHSSQSNKPTLVFDMVEVFRQMVVDREIISILNRGTKISSSKGRLSKKSIKVITENVQERLATPTKWRKGKYKLMTIIDEQALELAHVIKGIKSNFKGFVGRF